MSEDKPIPETTSDAPGTMKVASAPPARRHSRSAFAPIVLIAAGVFFLLANLGVVGALDWEAAWRFWPLALIFVGLNVLVLQLRPPLGTAMSALVALVAVAVFGYLLLSGTPTAAMRSLGLPEAEVSELHDESFWVPLDGVQTAEITIDLSNYPAEIGSPADGGLIGGTIYTRGELDTEFELDGGHARYQVGERSSGWMFNPQDWFSDESRTWTFSISPDVPIDLTIDAGNGSATADLSELTLSDLDIDAANGSVTAVLPDGDYDVRLDGGNGGIALTLPESGEREMHIDGGNGGITLLLPAGVEARVEYETGNGSVGVDGRFERVSGDDDEGVYQTAGYEGAANRVLVEVNTGNGSLSIAMP